MPLTPKQKAFADYYIETGNATEAARRAGYSKKTAYSIGDENLKKPVISAYIKSRMAEIDAGRIATADEERTNRIKKSRGLFPGLSIYPTEIV